MTDLAPPERASPAVGGYRGDVLELVYTSILVAAFLFIGWFGCYVVYKLYEGQD